MKKKYKFLTLIIFLITLNFSAQTSPADESKRLMTLFQKLEGTYQIQILDSRDKTEIPLVLMDTIQAKRHLTEIVFFHVKNNVQLMILPISTINNGDFKRIERQVNISSQKTTVAK